MTVLDWAAVLGALAWTPHLASWIASWISKSQIRVVTSRTAEIGFTTYGPRFNLRLAFSVSKKDIVISEIKIRLTHEGGEEKVLEWEGIVQHLGKMTLPNAGAMPYEKEHSVLAIKLNQKDIEERFIRFQDTAFFANQKDYLDKALKKMAYLQGEQTYEAEAFLRSEEMVELYNFTKHAYSWKPGKYKFVIEIKSPEKFSITDNVLEFNLSPIAIENLHSNKALLEVDYRRSVLGGVDPTNWQWENPALSKA